MVRLADYGFSAISRSQIRRGSVRLHRISRRYFQGQDLCCTLAINFISHLQLEIQKLTASKGNAGDSRSVLGIKGRAKPLSFDHKPSNEGEKARICAAGGFVDFGRVNGNLALSRAIGDFEFKKSADLPPEQQIVTAFPDVTVHELGDDDEFLVIACDGKPKCDPYEFKV